MYLIFSSEDSATYLMERSVQLNVNMIYIPVMEIIANQAGVKKLADIVDEYDYVVITSAYAIKSVDGVLKAAINPVFIAPGQETAAKLTALAISSTVLSPLKNSGSEAIIVEVLANLDLNHKKVLIVRGELANADITKYLSIIGNVVCNEIIIYQQKLLDLDAVYLIKLLTDGHLQGIIITSSLLANHMLKQAEHGGYLPLLQHSKFITIHPNVRDILLRNKITNVHLTKQASLADILYKIKGVI